MRIRLGPLPVVALLTLVLAAAPVLAAGHPSTTDVFVGEGAFAHATVDGVRYDEGLGGVRLVGDASGGFVRSGTFTLPDLHAPAAFNRAVPSWNADCPPGTFVAIELAASPDGGRTWGNWLEAARWGDREAIKLAHKEPVAKADDTAKINEDTFELEKPADRVRLRVTLRSDRPTATPIVTLVALALSNVTQEISADDSPSGAWGKETETTFRSQTWEHSDVSNRICGPTSTAMMLTAHGVVLPTTMVARASWDIRNRIYGNWSFIAAAASDLMRRHADALPARPGHRKVFRSWVAWPADWKQVEQEVEAGNPVVVSIRFKQGELKNAPIRSTDGHLILVTGFTQAGDPIAQDPAAKTAAKGRIVYDRQELHRARHGGPVIVFHPYD